MQEPELTPYSEALAVTEEGLEPQNHLNAKAGSAAGSERERDAESLFSADLARTTVLTREQEFELARKIVRARRRIRALLRRASKLTRAALADGGRGVVAPEDDFREREAVLILEHARRALHHRRTTATTGLARKDLRAFVTALSTALADYRELRDEMVRANVRLVSLLARRYRHPTLTFLDLFQEGTIGLVRAVEKFEPERNVKFSTYASWWIWQQLGRAADTQGGLIRTPVHWGQLRRRVSREEQEFAIDNDGPPTRENLASMEGIDRARLEAMSQSFHFVSIDASVSDDDERLVESTLAGDGPEPDEYVEQSALRAELDLAIRQLPAREGMIVRQRFGLADDNTQTLDEIGLELGVSRERVRQLESRALEQLRSLCAARGLKDYLH